MERTLNKNKVDVWYVNPATLTDEVDTDGNYTGQKIATYGTVTKVRLPLYPSTSEITKQLFGIDCSFDMVSVSNTIVLQKDTLLFLTLPTANFGTTYDYKVEKIAKSLNTYNYGLRCKV